MRTRLAAALAITVILSGCRLYGGHGSTETLREDLSVALQEFRTTYEHASRDLSTIQSAGANPRVQELGEIFGAAVKEHALMLQEAEHRVEEASHGGYRTVSRLVGKLVAERAKMQDRYSAILLNAAKDAGIPVSNASLAGHQPTQAVPEYYQRIATEGAPSLNAILGALAQ
ncbi:MAG: hypothetical protein KDD65_03250 [Bacteroidetes bacterium]|nr:hypothetical protein [Bacteroidota bacterium]